ncbi:MAG: bifunctional hydroxymethylpyrimidine kinase/phosphomethylpyrimidine kinase [Gammaproteobacteria bacterium]
MVFSALDGTGGAGIVADCRAVSAAGALPLAVATGITAQNLDGVSQFWPVPSSRVRAQIAALRNAKIAACKIGVTGVAAVVVAENAPPAAKVVWDPVLSPTGGAPFADAKQKRRMLKFLLPRADMITPNRRELAELSGRDSVADGARALLDGGARMVLATDTREGARVRHELYAADSARPLWRAECRRRRGEYHGGGCFFSATLAARLARGDSPSAAADFAHRATLAAIDSALRLPSLGAQRLPIPAPIAP